MHELLYGLAPAAAGAWYGTRAWLQRRRAVPIGEPASPFTLRGTDGRKHSLASLEEPLVVLLFMSNRCPGVKAYDGRLRRLLTDYRGAARFVGINPIDAGLYPTEDLPRMRRALADRGLVDLLYLKDGDRAVARSFGAICTPEVVVLDQERRIRYRGRIDDAMVERDAKRHYLRDALDALAAGKSPRVTETAPLGCAIDTTATNPVVASAGRPATPAPARGTSRA